MSVATATPERVGRLRTALIEGPAGRGLITEFLPRDVAEAGESVAADFSDWSQFNQWPQSW
ncbi:hypothetical protein QEZ54_30985 [Catellatospora sp. KI3]|uniref:hypothetical protein n=1 Tax=Catellatospora sp. KI3 TaxID=3041620 RepID=UPI002482B52A|nr:hypothetical protein [Catellatospora sp. KI3]MDI1465403.1 hypothetical protein [Catellatospora sp. KI3]